MLSVGLEYDLRVGVTALFCAWKLEDRVLGTVGSLHCLRFSRASREGMLANGKVGSGLQEQAAAMLPTLLPKSLSGMLQIWWLLEILSKSLQI